MAREGNNPKRRIAAKGSIPKEALEELSRRATYVGSANHKRYPGDYGFNPPSNPRPWKSMCDAHRIVSKEEAQDLLKQGILKGMVSTFYLEGVPKYIWSVDRNGAVYEAKIGNGGYHGYRLEGDDDMSDIARVHWESR